MNYTVEWLAEAEQELPGRLVQVKHVWMPTKRR